MCASPFTPFYLPDMKLVTAFACTLAAAPSAYLFAILPAQRLAGAAAQKHRPALRDRRQRLSAHGRLGRVRLLCRRRKTHRIAVM